METQKPICIRRPLDLAERFMEPKEKSPKFSIDEILKKEKQPTEARQPSKTFRRRIRTIFTQKQLEKLEEKFGSQQYLVGQERVDFARSLGLNEIQVKVWFQNRRIKWRRVQHEKMVERLKQLKKTNENSPN